MQATMAGWGKPHGNSNRWGGGVHESSILRRVMQSGAATAGKQPTDSRSRRSGGAESCGSRNPGGRASQKSPVAPSALRAACTATHSFGSGAPAPPLPAPLPLRPGPPRPPLPLLSGWRREGVRRNMTRPSSSSSAASTVRRSGGRRSPRAGRAATRGLSRSRSADDDDAPPEAPEGAAEEAEAPGAPPSSGRCIFASRVQC